MKARFATDSRMSWVFLILVTETPEEEILFSKDTGSFQATGIRIRDALEIVDDGSSEFTAAWRSIVASCVFDTIGILPVVVGE
ncbi:MAG: hypothetical protein DRQ40_05310, partial [Gammaproteobacteria bacterium]